MKIKVHIFVFAIQGLFMWPQAWADSISAQQQDPNNRNDLFEMSIEELMEVPVVVSASRQPQKVSQLSVPVSVITDEDIHYSGLVSIPEILQFGPGVDVRKIDRLDMTLSKTFADHKAELMFGVSDVFNVTEGPNTAVGQFTAHDVPGRTFFARLQLKF
jgi:outer membrane receptor protein involved in Fe transport